MAQYVFLTSSLKARGQLRFPPVCRLHCNSQEVALGPKVVRSLQLICHGMSTIPIVGSENESLM
jgi:hypothetical protein